MDKTPLRGFKRKDGRVGFRNWVLVLPMTGCQMTPALRIANKVPGTTCFAHPNGCDLHGSDYELFGSFLERFATHPNVGGVVILAMGCAQTLNLHLPQKIKDSGRLVEVLNAHESTSKLVGKGIETARDMVGKLSKISREEVDLSSLVLGTKCGASDTNSFEYCHPVTGWTCDLLANQGATVVLSENGELTGGANKLAERAATHEIGERIIDMARNMNDQWEKRFGIRYDERSGKSAEEQEKATLRHAAKAGSGQINGFFDMSETVEGPGLVILDAPNTDLENVTALAGAGCNMTLFTTGRGTPVGSPTSITVKVTATQSTFDNMRENIDLCVADVIEGEKTVDQEAERLMEFIINTANGELTAAENVGCWEVATPIQGVTF